MNAMAASAGSEVYKTLANAAKESGYSWERSAACEKYLEYADNVAVKGNIKLMEKICKQVIKKADNKSGMQYKSAAISIIALHKGEAAIDMLIGLFSEPDIELRQHPSARLKACCLTLNSDNML